MSDGLLVLDLQLRIADINAAARHMLSKAGGEISGCLAQLNGPIAPVLAAMTKTGAGQAVKTLEIEGGAFFICVAPHCVTSAAHCSDMS